MAFTLETIFSSRPARQSSEPDNRPPRPSGKGADFAKSLSGRETDQRDSDEPELLSRTDAGQVSAAAILINSQPNGDTPSGNTAAVTDDAALLAVDGQAAPTVDLAGTPGGTPAADTVDVPEALLGQAATDAAELPELTLEQAAPETTEIPEAHVEQQAAGAVGSPEDLAAQGESDSDTNANAVKPAASVQVPAPTEAPSLADANTDSPPEADIARQPSTADPATQATLASAISPAAASAEPTTRTKDKSGAVTSTPSASRASTLAGEAASPKGDRPARTSAHGDIQTGDADQLTSAARVPAPGTAADSAASAKAVMPQDMAISTQSGLAQAPTTQAPASPVPSAMTATHSLISASPAQVVEIISDSIAAPEDRKDRIQIQLDPPELGRVSIDFKFDANGLQHVTVTGETPEALRQLRAMHFELVNALERQGLSSQNMSFEQHQARQEPGQQAARSGQADGDIVADTDVAATSIAAARNAQSRSTAAGSLNIKL